MKRTSSSIAIGGLKKDPKFAIPSSPVFAVVVSFSRFAIDSFEDFDNCAVFFAENRERVL